MSDTRHPAPAPADDAADERAREHIVIVGVDLSGTIVHANDDSRELLGFGPDELIGTELIRLVPERLREPHRAGFDRFCRTGQLGLVGRRLRLPALHADGREVDVELVLSVPSSGDPAAVVGVLREADNPDPTGQLSLVKRIRQVLKDDRPIPDLLGQCLEVIGQRLGFDVGTLWVLDPWMNRVRVLAMWEADPGRQPTFVEHTRRLTMHPDEGLAGSVWGTSAPLLVTQLPAQPGFIRAESAAADELSAGLFLPLLDGGYPVGVLELVGRDVDQRRAESQEITWALADEVTGMIASRLRGEIERAQRDRVELALSAGGMGVWTYHLPSGHVAWDERLERVYGLEPGEFSGSFNDYASRIHPDDREQALSSIRRAIERHDRFEYGYRAIKPDGSIVWLEGAGHPVVGADGGLEGMTGVCFDVSDRVIASDELEERARHAALAADVGRAFVSGDDLRARLQATVEAVVRHLDAAFARIWTVAAEADTLELQASAGLYTHLDGAHARVRIGELKIGRIAATREPHLTNRVVGDPRVSDQEWAQREGMVSFAGYPLVLGDRCVGVLAMFARRELPRSTLDALGSIADTVAVGVGQSWADAEVRTLLAAVRQHATDMEVALLERARVAEELQRSLLPPQLPDMAGWDVHGRYRPGAELVGGDFYDVFPLRDGEWAFMIGDICGHGPEAARLTALARHSLRTALMLGHAPGAAVEALNEAMYKADSDRRFCSVVCGTCRRTGATASIELSVAGHPPPVVVEGDGRARPLGTDGPIVGVFPDARFGTQRFELPSAGGLVLYTDGATEARRGGELFGEQRLLDLLARRAGATAKVIADAVVDAVVDYDEEVGHDDLAVVVLRLT